MSKATLSSSSEFDALWPWIHALNAFDYGDAEPLSALIEAEGVPERLRLQIASVIRGVRRPKKRAAAKIVVKASDRMHIAQGAEILIELIDAMKAHAGEIAARKGKEPIEVRRRLEADRKAALEKIADDAGISLETLENLLREFRALMKSFPSV